MKKIPLINAPAPSTGLLKRPELYALSLGQVIGAGVITTVGPAIGMTGYSAWVAYAAALVIGLIFVAPWFFITSTLRLGGGQYSLVAKLAGPRLAGMVGVAFIPQMFLLALFGTALGIYLNSLFPAFPAQWFGIIGFTLIFFINIMGITWMARFQKLMTWILIGSLMLFVIVGLFNVKNPVLDVSQQGFVSNGFPGFLAATFILYYSCTGYLVVSIFGKDAKVPRRDIPWAMIAVFFSLIVLYCGVAIVNAGVLPLDQVAGKPLTGVASAIFPQWLFYLFIIGGPIMALTTTINSTLAMYPYVVGQAAKDGWLPKSYQTTNRFGAAWKILVTCYLFGVVPQLINFNVNTIITNILLFISAISFLNFIAFYNLPKKYPEAWKKAKLHIPNWLYYVIVSASAAVNLYVFYRSLTTLNVVQAIVSVSLLVISAVYALLRANNKNVAVNTSVWSEEEEKESLA